MELRVEISGKQMDVGDALRTHVTDKVTEAVAKYGIRPVEAKIVISRDAHLFVCDCSLHLSTGLRANARAEEVDAYAACDAAAARLEKQLRRHKRRLKDHHQRRNEPIAHLEASAYVLASQADDGDEDTESDAVVETADGSLWRPVIIAESKEKIPSLTVGEAVMQMELSGDAFLVFINDAHQRLNAVYKRDDGNIGWIDPTT